MLSECETDALHGLLVAAGLPSDAELIGRLSGDGSDRRFYRLLVGALPLIAVLPGEAPQAMAEAKAAFLMGRHFFDHGGVVPQVYGFAEDCGLLLFEDLGDIRLHDLVLQYGPTAPAVEEGYRLALAGLVRLQVDARAGFDPGWCWDTPGYDRQLMLSRESGYFIKALCEDYLGLTALPVGLDREFVRLADLAAAQPADFVLHRDFQSRNLMVQEGEEGRLVKIIDFQGARLGPLAYDPASLLLDPYAALPPDQQEKLLRYYLDLLAEKIELDRNAFLEGYLYLALQRNLQILGAFAFLTQKRGKLFFSAFIAPALESLRCLLASSQGGAFPILGRVVEDAKNALARG